MAIVQMKTISLLRLERVLFVVGGILLVVSATARIHGELSARWAIQEFEAARSESANSQTKNKVDMSQWSARAHSRVQGKPGEQIGSSDGGATHSET